MKTFSATLLAATTGFLVVVLNASPFTMAIIDAPGATSTHAFGINDAGQIVGYFTDATGDHGFVRSGGMFTTIDVPGATSTYPYGINDAGQIVGYFTDATGEHGFAYLSGTVTEIAVPGATSTHAFGINDADQIVGYFTDATGNHGFVSSGGTFTVIDVPGATSTYPAGINHDQIVGYFTDASADHGFLATHVLSSLTLSKSVLAGCLKATGKVTLLAPAPPGGQVVTVKSDNLHAVVPASVTVKAGRVSSAFTIATAPVASSEVATITVGIGGFTRSATLTLRPMALKSIALSPNPVVGGNLVAGTVTLQCPAGPGDIVVALSSTMPTVAMPTTASVTVFQGTTTAPFDVTTATVPSVKKPAIEARANGSTKSKTLLVNP